MRRRLLAGGAVGVVVVAALVLVLVDPFGGGAPAASIDNGTPTAVQTVTRRDLSSQTQVSATLGYAGTSTISAVSGTAPSALQQAEQQAQTAQTTLATDERALAQAQAALAADERKAAVDCGGTNAAGGTGSPCTADAQALATDRQAVANATTKLQADRISAHAATTALALARATATPYGQSAVYTMLPKAGDIVRRGQALYAIDGRAVSLLYGSVPASRAFTPGMSPGRDVAELNANLRALGYGAPSGDAFTSATSTAISAFQKARGLAPTGTLLLGSIVFEPGAVRVTSVTPAAGAPVQAGAVLSITSTRRVVTIALDASQQASVKVGDPVDITLPDNSTTPGRVTFVGTVATTPSSQNGGSSTPTIEVDVTPDHPAATGRIDQATVDVSITTATVRNVLTVPVNALLSITGGGYAVEEVAAGGTHHLVGVTLGLFDDAEGLVQVSGSGIAAGQHVVVPAS